MTQNELADALTSGLFASRPTMKEAYEYAEGIATACGKQNAIYVLTAIHVMMNTIANEVRKIENDPIILT